MQSESRRHEVVPKFHIYSKTKIEGSNANVQNNEGINIKIDIM